MGRRAEMENVIDRTDVLDEKIREGSFKIVPNPKTTLSVLAENIRLLKASKASRAIKTIEDNHLPISIPKKVIHHVVADESGSSR